MKGVLGARRGTQSLNYISLTLLFYFKSWGAMGGQSRNCFCKLKKDPSLSKELPAVKRRKQPQDPEDRGQRTPGSISGGNEERLGVGLLPRAHWLRVRHVVRWRDEWFAPTRPGSSNHRHLLRGYCVKTPPESLKVYHEGNLW